MAEKIVSILPGSFEHRKLEKMAELIADDNNISGVTKLAYVVDPTGAHVVYAAGEVATIPSQAPESGGMLSSIGNSISGLFGGDDSAATPGAPGASEGKGMLGKIGDTFMNAASSIFGAIQDHPAISSAIITYLLSDGDLGDTAESFIWGYLFNDPGAGIGAGMGDGIIGTIAGAAGGTLGNGLLKSFVGPSTVGASYYSRRKYAAPAASLISAAKDLVGKAFQSGVSDPSAIMNILQQNMGGSFDSLASGVQSNLQGSMGNFLGQVMDGGEMQQKATEALNNNPTLNQKYQDLTQAEEEKKKNEQAANKPQDGTQENDIADPQAATQQDQETQTTLTNEPLTTQSAETLTSNENKAAQYTNPYRSRS